MTQDINELLVEPEVQAVDLVHSREWGVIKKLLITYAGQLVSKGINLSAEESNDRKRAVFLSTGKYFEDFINQIEQQAQKEVLDNKNKQQRPTDTVAEF